MINKSFAQLILAGVISGVLSYLIVMQINSAPSNSGEIDAVTV